MDLANREEIWIVGFSSQLKVIFERMKIFLILLIDMLLIRLFCSCWGVRRDICRNPANSDNSISTKLAILRHPIEILWIGMTMDGVLRDENRKNREFDIRILWKMENRKKCSLEVEQKVDWWNRDDLDARGSSKTCSHGGYVV
ncbi:unnamed protein product [Caenorhabditis angaria]|uniref:Uncharacterized protein n=1 Tax=Caenorhabditis angaria TaxID=860376 RepID=A0A9P1MVE1_9PELO|nr:unnamed protein product [Caenorhabditis angaria]